MNELITVIIPAYNVAPYIEKCVESVVKQTYRNLEIIIVDDGSTDDTPQICDRLEKTDNRIKVIHQRNGGLSVARNVGLDNANGQWIAFLDSDDWIEEKMYEVLYVLAQTYNAEISSCMFRKVYIDDSNSYKQSKENIDVFSSFDMVMGLLTQEKVRYEVWNKLWKRELIGETRFIPGQVSEDIHFDRILFLKAKKMVHTSQVLHNYLVDRPGNTNSSFKYAKMEIFDEFKEFLLSVKENDELVGCVASLATTFIIAYYSEAVMTKQNKNLKRQIKNMFNYFYPIAIHCKAANKKLYYLFRVSPSGYVFYLKTRLKKYSINRRN